ncbi:MAG TPA: tetratricopeptide repeat protein [Pirellulales bacterium]|nr:tetratricopeptide repeat protein [Pirellulales bacterium]
MSLKSSRLADDWARDYRVWTVCGFLLLAVGLVFGQTVRYGFVGFDDDQFVYENPHVTAGLTFPGLWWALTDGTFGEWTPLSSLSHMADCELYGVQPAGHHLTNLLLHATSSVLLFLVLLRMTGDLWPSAWVAAVFAIHPLHVESVAWLAERRDVLSGLFFMLILGAYALYAERPSVVRYLALAGLCALGLMAKPMLVTVPFLLLLLDYWPLGRFRQAIDANRETASRSWLGRMPVGWRLLAEKVPLFLLAAVACGITLSTHASVQSNSDVEQLPLGSRVANALVSYAAYLGQSFYPIDLSPYYPHLGTHLPITAVAGSVVLLVAITTVAAFCWRRLPYLLVGWLWFLGLLVPVSGLVGDFIHARADRYTYLSQIGLSIALAWGVWTLYQSRQSVSAAPWRAAMLAVVSGAAVLLLAAVAWRQTTYWRTGETLWMRALSCTDADQNLVPRYNLATIYLREQRIEEAITQLQEGLATESVNRQSLTVPRMTLADALALQRRFDEAITQYEEAVRLSPTSPPIHYRLAQALAVAGKSDRAVAEWREAIRLDPNFLRARIDLASALLKAGNATEAAAECHEVLNRRPNVTEAIVLLGEALVARGEIDEAIPHLKHALELEPRNARAHFRLGLAQYDRGRWQNAVDQLNAVVRLQPDDVSMLWQTAWILATSPELSIRNGSQAVELATKAVQLSGGRDVHAFDALAAAQAEAGEFTAAIEAADQASVLALALSGDDAALVDAIEQRTSLYRQGLPYRQPARSSAGQERPKADP